MASTAHHTLQGKLGHDFKDETLLLRALTHKSVGGVSNERLEFLGDAILNYTVGEMLYTQFPTLTEGDLSRVRAGMVCHDSLVKIATRLEIAPLLKVDPNHRVEKSKDSILSDALEAIFAAIQLDAGHEKAKAVIIKHMLILLQNGEAVLKKDPKTALQEHLQARGIPVPSYELVSSGTPYARQFDVKCAIPALKITASGHGASRKHAEKDAAEKALRQCAR